MFFCRNLKPEMYRTKRRKVGNRKSEPNSDESQVMKMSIESALCFSVGSSLSIAHADSFPFVATLHFGAAIVRCLQCVGGVASDKRA